jgi:endoglucanase
MNNGSVSRAAAACDRDDIRQSWPSNRWVKGGLIALCLGIVGAALVALMVAQSHEARAAELKAEAENMTLSGSAVLVHSAASASGGKDVVYYSKGSATATFSGTPTGVNLRAKEAYCRGDAKLRVFVDGTEKGTITLTSSAYADYPFSVSGVGSGSHQIRIDYINDFSTTRCDRNAYLDYYTITTNDTLIDSDGDGVADGTDNCPRAANASQSDMDGDGTGDVCDVDMDGDSVDNASDNCPSAGNADQKDSDSDGIGDACDGTPFPPPDTASNPFAGEKLYVDPNSKAAQSESQLRSAGRTADADLMHKIAAQPASPVYLSEWTEDPSCCDGVRFYTKYYADRWHADGSLPVLGLYAIPFRDCGSYSGGGFTTAEQYKAWIDQAALGQSDYGKKIVWILEPDALAGGDSCLTSAQRTERNQLLAYAVDKLTTVGGKVYIDAGHPGWKPVDTIVSRLKAAHIDNAQGFALNNANFMPTKDNITYGTQISQGVGGAHFIIDTGRNGNGYYSGTHDGDCPEWANPPGRALGERPSANTGNSLVDAYYWLKPPGASDADCGPFPRAGAWVPDLSDATYGADTYDALGLAKRAAW